MTHSIDKVAWIEIVDKRLLSVRSRGKDAYYLPGGKREAGETDQACLVREIKEELAVDIAPDTLAYVGQFAAPAHGQEEGVMVSMTCYSGSYTGTLSPASEIEALLWLSYADRHKTSPVVQLILDWLKQRSLIE